MEGLTVGRNVHYVAYDGTHLAGIIIGVESYEDNIVDLVIFTSMKNVNGVKNFGTQFHQNVRHADGHENRPGSWDFIKRA